MNLYYLENKLAGKSYQQHKYYTGCGDMECDAGSDNLSDARFFLQKEDAEGAIKSANDWWEKHDYEVKSIDIEALIAQGKNQLNLQLILPEQKKPKKVTVDSSIVDKMDLQIKFTNLSQRAQNVLERAGVMTIGELVQYSRDELRNLRGAGTAFLFEVENMLDEYGLSLSGAVKHS